jgi:hypothetical protein
MAAGDVYKLLQDVLVGLVASSESFPQEEEDVLPLLRCLVSHCFGGEHLAVGGKVDALHIGTDF